MWIRLDGTTTNVFLDVLDDFDLLILILIDDFDSDLVELKLSAIEGIFI
jgi:hypothetical protein